MKLFNLYFVLAFSVYVTCICKGYFVIKNKDVMQPANVCMLVYVDVCTCMCVCLYAT